MSVHEEFRKYALEVSSKLRLKAAREPVRREIENHLYDQYEALLKSGMSESDAVKESIRQTGDSEALGISLDRIHRPKPDLMLISIVILLCFAGLYVRYFLSAACGSSIDLAREITALIIGSAFMVTTCHLDFTMIGKRPYHLYFGILAHGIIANYSQNTVNGFGSFMPYIACFMPLGIAGIMYAMRGKKLKGLFASVLALFACLYLCLSSNNMTWSLIVLLSGLISFLVCANRDWFSFGKKKTFLFASCLTATGVLLFIFRLLSSGYRLERFRQALFPTEPGGVTNLIRSMISESKWIGQGSAQIYRDMSFWGSDYVLSSLAHSAGILFSAVLVIMILFFSVRLMLRSLKEKSTLASLVALNVSLVLLFQSLFYIISNLGVPIFSTVSLPLISSGNTFTVINMTLTGIALSVFRTGKYQSDPPPIKA